MPRQRYAADHAVARRASWPRWFYSAVIAGPGCRHRQSQPPASAGRTRTGRTCPAPPARTNRAPSATPTPVPARAARSATRPQRRIRLGGSRVNVSEVVGHLRGEPAGQRHRAPGALRLGRTDDPPLTGALGLGLGALDVNRAFRLRSNRNRRKVQVVDLQTGQLGRPQPGVRGEFGAPTSTSPTWVSRSPTSSWWATASTTPSAPRPALHRHAGPQGVRAALAYVDAKHRAAQRGRRRGLSRQSLRNPCHPSRTVRHCHRFPHLRRQSGRLSF